MPQGARPLQGPVVTVSFDCKDQTCFTISEIQLRPVWFPLGTCTGFANQGALGVPWRFLRAHSGGELGDGNWWASPMSGTHQMLCLVHVWLGFCARPLKKGFWSEKKPESYWLRDRAPAVVVIVPIPPFHPLHLLLYLSPMITFLVVFIVVKCM